VDIEIEVRVWTERAARRRIGAIGLAAWNVDLVLAALLHLRKGLGEAGDDLPGDHRLRAAVTGAVVEDRAVGEPALIFDEDAVHRLDECARARLYGADADARRGRLTLQRRRARPGETDSCADHDQQSNGQLQPAPAVSGTVSGFACGHVLRLRFRV